jgi:hypothetical protein
MEDVLALYERPLSEREPVVCVDEKPVVLHADVRPPRPMRPGRIARCDSEYKRQGTADVFCGVQPKAGKHFTKATPNRSSPEFADYLVEIAASYPQADTIHLVIDNLSTHRRTALVERFGENIGGLLWDHFTLRNTPTHGSWLDQAEIEISLFAPSAWAGVESHRLHNCIGKHMRIPVDVGSDSVPMWAPKTL